MNKNDFTSRHIYDHDHDFDGIVRSDKASLRKRLDDMLAEFLGRGGKIDRHRQPTFDQVRVKRMNTWGNGTKKPPQKPGAK